MSLVEYSILKLIAVEWSMGKAPSWSIRKTLHDKYGVRTILDLDRVIHKIHEKLQLSDTDIRASGDGLVLVGLLESYNHHVIEAKGDGWKEPLVLMLEYLTGKVKFSANKVEIVYDIDSPLDEIDYGLRYIEGVDEAIKEYKSSIKYENGLVIIPIVNPSIIEYALSLLEAYGLKYVRVEEKTDHYLYMFKPETDVRETIDITSEILAVYTMYFSEGVPEPEHPKSEVEVVRLLDSLRRLLPVQIEYSRPRYLSIHEHTDMNRIDVHVVGEIIMHGEFSKLFKAVSIILSALDHNYEITTHKEGLVEARRLVHSLARLFGDRKYDRYTHVVVYV